MTAPHPVVVRQPDGGRTDALRFAAREAELHHCGLRIELGGSVASLIDASPDARLVVFEHQSVLQVLQALSRPTDGGLAAHACVPVALVPDGWTAGGRGGTVTVGVESPEDCHSLLRRAFLIARAHGARLRVLHAWTFPRPYDERIVQRVGHDWTAHVTDVLTAAVRECRPPDPRVDVAVDVRHGEPAEILTAAADESELVVLGRHDARTPAGSHLGRVARTLLYAGSCPVVLLPGHGSAGTPTGHRAASAVSRRSD